MITSLCRQRQITTRKKRWEDKRNCFYEMNPANVHSVYETNLFIHFLSANFNKAIVTQATNVKNRICLRFLFLFLKPLSSKFSQFSRIVWSFERNSLHYSKYLLLSSSFLLLTWPQKHIEIWWKTTQMIHCPVRPPPIKKGYQGKKINCIWWWGFSSREMGTVEYFFIVNIP